MVGTHSSGESSPFAENSLQSITSISVRQPLAVKRYPQDRACVSAWHRFPNIAAPTQQSAPDEQLPAAQQRYNTDVCALS